MNPTDIETFADFQRVYVHSATARTLAPFLDPGVPWIWILRQMPNPVVQWWRTRVPFTRSGDTFAGLVRYVVHDLQIPTSEFVDRVGQFVNEGITLIQSTRPIPDTLLPDRMEENARRQAIIQNGAVLAIWLPHSMETGQVESNVPGHCSRVLNGHFRR